MEKQISTVKLLDYIETYNKYEHLIEKNIMKVCPEFMNNEDFIQDIKVGILDYIENNKSFNNLTTDSMRSTYVSNYMHRFIKKLYIKYVTYNNCSMVDIYDFYNKIYYNNIINNCGINEAINKAISDLEEEEANIIKLHFFDNLNITEISKIEGISWCKANIILRNGLKKLRHPSISRSLKVYIQEY